MLTKNLRNFRMAITITMLSAFLSNGVMADCFSYKNTWYTDTIKPKTPEWGVFESLQLGAGQMQSFECYACDDEKMWAVSSVSHTGLVFRFKTKVGDFIFRADPNVELKVTDIDFNDSQDTGGQNRIYREIVLKGTISIPGGAAAKDFGAKPPRAALVLRGMGLNCFETGVIQHWLLRVDTDNRQLTGAGSIKP
jgi:hypothetical protein